jgi:hypothetical protein
MIDRFQEMTASFRCMTPSYKNRDKPSLYPQKLLTNTKKKLQRIKKNLQKHPLKTREKPARFRYMIAKFC